MSDPLIRRIGNYDINFSQPIGKGSFAVVWYARQISTGRDVAIKLFHREKLEEMVNKDRNYIDREISLLNRLKGEKFFSLSHLTEFIEARWFEIDTFRCLGLVFEYCNAGNLELFIKQRIGGIQDENELRFLFSQVRDAFRFLQKRHIIHRDVKTSNFLIHITPLSDSQIAKRKKENFPEYTRLNLKLSDFDFIRVDKEYDIEAPSAAPSICGTITSWSPETLESRGRIYTSESEMWSLGLILYEMLFGKAAFAGSGVTNMEMLANLIKSGHLFKKVLKKNPSEELRSLLQGLLELDAKKRLSWQQFNTHAFFSSREVEVAPVEAVTLPLIQDSHTYLFEDYFTEKGDIASDDLLTRSKPILIVQHLPPPKHTQEKNYFEFEQKGSPYPEGTEAYKISTQSSSPITISSHLDANFSLNGSSSSSSGSPPSFSGSVASINRVLSDSFTRLKEKIG